MNKARLEAFSDGVLAILITIMVLNLKIPLSPDIKALLPLYPIILSYILSFIYLGIYWNSHHHMLGATRKVNGRILWANLHLLFWLSLLPFTTGWLGENDFARWPMVVYGVNLLAYAGAYLLLQNCLLTHHGQDSILAMALGGAKKGCLSSVLYAAGIVLAYHDIGWLAMTCFAGVAGMWIVPDRKIEELLTQTERQKA